MRKFLPPHLTRLYSSTVPEHPFSSVTHPPSKLKNIQTQVLATCNHSSFSAFAFPPGPPDPAGPSSRRSSLIDGPASPIPPPPRYLSSLPLADAPAPPASSRTRSEEGAFSVTRPENLPKFGLSSPCAAADAPPPSVPAASARTTRAVGACCTRMVVGAGLTA